MRSIAYAPPERVTLLGAPLHPGEVCPTLHRYPGPCGLASFFAGSLTHLAPGDLLWMSETFAMEDSLGARRFGTLVVARPLRFQPVRVRPGIFVGENLPLIPDDDIRWLPPARGVTRAAVIDDLCAYLEELDALRASGLVGPGVPWLTVPLAERRRYLAAARLSGAWTDRVSSAA